MDSPYHYPITIRLESVEGEPINGDEMFVARCEHFPGLAMAERSPQRLMAMIEKVWAVKWSRTNAKRPLFSNSRSRSQATKFTKTLARVLARGKIANR